MKTSTLLHLLVSAAALAAPLVPQNIRAAAGDLYVSETGSNSILKFTPAGSKSTFVSGLSGGLAFDRSGNLFVASGDTIFKVTPDGSKSTFASGLDGARSPAFDGIGNLFVVAHGPDEPREGFNLILKFTPDGTQSTFHSSAILDGATFFGLAFDSSGNLFTTIYGPSGPDDILKFTPDGSESTFGPPITAVGLVFDGSGNLFVVDVFNGRIVMFTPDGVGPIPFASGVSPSGLAFDASGNLVATADTGTIFKFTAGDKSTFASGLNQPGPLAFEPVMEKLRNVSARGLVGTGDNVLIGGFIVGGNAVASNTVVVRAIGPSLSQFGVTNPLQDPSLELHNASGAIIASNDNWQDSQAEQITATGFAPADSHESAIFAVLPAGNFTAVVRGAGATTGVALLEVYSVK